MRLLAPNDYAVAAIAAGLYGLALTFVEWSITPILVRQTNITLVEERQLFSYSFFLSLVFALGFVLVSIFSNRLVEGSRYALWIQAVALLFIPLRLVGEARLLRSGKFGHQNRATLLEIVVIAIVTLTLAFTIKNYLAISVGLLTGIACRCVYSMKMGGALWPEFSLNSFKSMFGRTRLIAGADALNQLAVAAPTYIIGYFLGGHALGLISTAMHLITLPSSRLMSVLNQVYLPVLAKSLSHDKAEFKLLTSQAIQGVFWISLPIYVGLALVSTPVTLVVLGEKWKELDWILSAMCITMPLKMFRDFIINPLRAANEDTEIFNKQLSLAFFQILAGFAASSGDLKLTVVAFAVVGIATSCFTIKAGLRILQIRLRTVFSASVRPLICTGIMALACVAVSHLFKIERLEIQLVANVASGFLTYCICAFFFVSRETRCRVFVWCVSKMRR